VKIRLGYKGRNALHHHHELFEFPVHCLVAFLKFFFGKNKTNLLRENAAQQTKSQNFIQYLAGEVYAAEQLNEAYSKSVC